MAARKKDDTEQEQVPAGYHGHAAADRGYDSRPEDVAGFPGHLELDRGVTVHHGGAEAVSVTSPDEK